MFRAIAWTLAAVLSIVFAFGSFVAGVVICLGAAGNMGHSDAGAWFAVGLVAIVFAAAGAMLVDDVLNRAEDARREARTLRGAGFFLFNGNGKCWGKADTLEDAYTLNPYPGARDAAIWAPNYRTARKAFRAVYCSQVSA